MTEKQTFKECDLIFVVVASFEEPRNGERPEVRVVVVSQQQSIRLDPILDVSVLLK